MTPDAEHSESGAIDDDDGGAKKPPEATSARPAEKPAEAPPKQEKQARKEAPGRPRAFRYLFYALWIFLLPAALAITAVRLIKPEPWVFNPPMLRRLVAEQQVPATIMFFTLFAWLLWRFRYVLPLAGPAGVLGRSDLPASLRAKYDEAGQLISEARRILDSRSVEIKRALTKKERDGLEQALDKLDATMGEREVDPKRFYSALAKAETLVAQHLGRWRKGELREYLESIGVAVAVALILRFFVIEAFKIPSGSMIPTLMIGDHIFVAKYAYGPLLPRSDARLYERLPPARGDVMVFKFPENKEQDFIKRVIALPGDTLEAIDGRPIINGWLAPHCYVGRLDQPEQGATGHLYVEYIGEASYLTMFDDQLDETACREDRDCGGARSCRAGVCGIAQGPYQVAPNEVWVMGDNRNNSHDSRSWRGGMGAGVPFENIKGRAMFVWFSWDEKSRSVRLDRLFEQVMGAPELPQPAGPELAAALRRCLSEPPAAEATHPPAPPPRRR